MSLASRLALGWVLSIAAATAAQASITPVYRCGETGRSYGDRACGSGQLLLAADTRSERQRAEAQAVVQRDLALARSLREDRLAREREARGAAGIQDGATADRLGRAAPRTPSVPDWHHSAHADDHARPRRTGRHPDPRVSFEARVGKPVKVKAPSPRRPASAAGHRRRA